MSNCNPLMGRVTALILSFYSFPTILILGIAIKLFKYTAYPPFWDACSFILIGKYIFSLGQVGALEAFRPIVWPLILGSFWKIGGDPVLWGRLTEFAAGVGCIGLVYLIGKNVYGRFTGLLAATFMVLSPTFFIWGNSLCSDVFASSLSLLTFYLYTREKFFWVGVVGALTFLSKFPQLIVVGIIGMSIMFFSDGVHRNRVLRDIVTGFVSIACLFLIFFLNLYGDLWLPFKEGMISYPYFLTNWISGISKSLRLLIFEENWLLLFSGVSVICAHVPRRQRMKWAICWIAIISFAWTGKFAVDHHRLSISALPYLFLLSAEGIILTVDYFHRKEMVQLYPVSKVLQYFILEKRGIIPRCSITLDITNLMKRGIIRLFLALVFILCVSQVLKIKQMHFPENRLNIIQKYVHAFESQMRGKIWMTNPNQLVFSNLRAEELIYNPIFNTQRIAELRQKLGEADFILWDSRDLICRNPDQVNLCWEAKRQLTQSIKKGFIAEFIIEDPKREIMVGVFKAKK